MRIKVLIVLLALLSLAISAYAAPNLANSAYAPVEWYTVPSLFFRSITNPGAVIPVMASDGYRLPVKLEGAVSITIGSSTFTASPVFSDANGSTTLALVDSSRRIVINIGSDTIGLLNKIASVTAEISASSATSTADLTALQASLSAKLTELMAQQATETINILAAQASTTARVAELKAQQATETLDVTASIASVTTAIQALSGSSATPTVILATITYSISSYTNFVLTPNVVYVITPITNMSMLSIALTDTSGEFWAGIGTTTVAVSTGRKVYSSILLNDMNLVNIPISIIASTALNISTIKLSR